jgi:glucose/arabinose dehydrogenase
MVIKRAGAGVPSPDRCCAMRTAMGIAEAHTVFIGGLHSPFGMALVGNPLYIAETDADALPLQSWRDAD